MTRPLERWGDWRYREETGTLEHPEHDPFFDVKDISSPSDVLSQIFAINKRPWAKAEVIKDLLRALDSLLDPANDYHAKTSRTDREP